MIKVAFLFFLPTLAFSFTLQRCHHVVKSAGNSPFSSQLQARENESITEEVSLLDKEMMLDPEISSQFKILTCSSTACTKKCQAFGIDEYALFSGLYQRKENAANGSASQVVVEETGCMGKCKLGPCVGVEHEDYYGRVALEGMTSNEFRDQVFHK